MKTLLSIYEKSENSNTNKRSIYSRQEVVTKHKSPLVSEAKTMGKSKFPNLVKMESSYDLDQYDTYLS